MGKRPADDEPHPPPPGPTTWASERPHGPGLSGALPVVAAAAVPGVLAWGVWMVSHRVV